VLTCVALSIHALPAWSAAYVAHLPVADLPGTYARP
jgi:hypothetical protein